METQKIVIFGCGNVANYFAEKFMLLNHNIIQVYHPDHKKSEDFAKICDAEAINNFLDIDVHADLYFISVKDDAIAEIASKIHTNKGLVAHTSGSVKLDVLNKHVRSAVFYPLQTFTKGIKTEHQNFPILIECNQNSDEKYLTDLAQNMGNSVQYMTSEQRTEIHLAAIFAANFSNHCIKIAYDLMQNKNHDAQILLPLIKESIHKLNFINPAQAQTGPAIRNDSITIEKHLALLNEETLKSIYEIITKHIQSSNQ